MRYVSQDEIDQIRMQLWNIFDNISRRCDSWVDPSNVMMVAVSYNKETGVFNCSIELVNGLSYTEVDEALDANLLFVDNIEIANNREDVFLQKNWNIQIKFGRRFFFRALYTPYFETLNVDYSEGNEYGLPVYTVIIPDDMPLQIFVDHLNYKIPNMLILNRFGKNRKDRLTIGSLVTPLDEQMDFAAPTGYKFEKGEGVWTDWRMGED